MKTSKHEFLSAFLDDEAGEFERRRLLDELNQDDELGQALGRYALVGEAMRSGKSPVIRNNRQFLAGIQGALEEEPEYTETVVQFADAPAANDGTWRKNAARFGMAASVAVAAIAGVLLLQPGDQQSATTEMASAVNDSATESVTQPVSLSSSDTTLQQTTTAGKPINIADSSRIRQGNKHLDWQTRDALKQYVTLHMQHRINNGIVPSIQAVSYSK